MPRHSPPPAFSADPFNDSASVFDLQTPGFPQASSPQAFGSRSDRYPCFQNPAEPFAPDDERGVFEPLFGCRCDIASARQARHRAPADGWSEASAERNRAPHSGRPGCPGHRSHRSTAGRQSTVSQAHLSVSAAGTTPVRFRQTASARAADLLKWTFSPMLPIQHREPQIQRRV